MLDMCQESLKAVSGWILKAVGYILKPSCVVSFVCFPEALPASNTALIAAAVCSALFLLVLIAVVACVVMRMLHNRHDYEGWVFPHATCYRPTPRAAAPVTSVKCAAEMEQKYQRFQHGVTSKVTSSNYKETNQKNLRREAETVSESGLFQM